MTIRLFTTLAALLLATATRAQTGGVRIGPAGPPDPAAALDVSSTTQGLLPPRLTQAQRDALTISQNLGAAQAGLLIFNTTTSVPNQWSGAVWTVPLVSSVSAPVTFAYTGGSQTYVVPVGITRLRVTAVGAAAGPYTYSQNTSYGSGAQATAILAVTPGETLAIVVGGQGTAGGTANTGGYNGGGSSANGGAGGGATDIRRATANGLTGDYMRSRNALLVAGGGGGPYIGSNGGAGGTPVGGAGMGAGTVGGGATQTATGASASVVNGGQGGSASLGGGGGGGYYGGGSGYNASGGGGSSWAAATSTNVAYSQAGTTGNGSLTLAPVLPDQPLVPASQVANLAWTQDGTTIYPTIPASNVGIGLTNPAVALHVAGHIRSNYGVQFADRTNPANNFEWLTQDGVARLYTSVGNQSVLSATSAGNVGIGTNTPAYELDVAGDAQVSGDLRVNGHLLVGLQTITQTASLPAHTVSQVTLSCPAGYTVLGGGGGYPAFTSDQSYVNLNYSGPDQTSPTTGWVVRFSNFSNNAVNLVFYCNCARLR